MNNQINNSLPDPKIIGPKALKAAAREKNTGLVCAYDSETQAGGIIHPDLENPRWVIFVPISESDFAIEVNKTIEPIINQVENPTTKFIN
jgi:hypothetical protein